jgi:hypothetical protein
MRAPLTLVSVAVALSACHPAPAPPDSSDQARARLVHDTSLTRLCASAPETTSAGTVGCVLKDQSQPPTVKPKP